MTAAKILTLSFLTLSISSLWASDHNKSKYDLYFECLTSDQNEKVTVARTQDQERFVLLDSDLNYLHGLVYAKSSAYTKAHVIEDDDMFEALEKENGTDAAPGGIVHSYRLYVLKLDKTTRKASYKTKEVAFFIPIHSDTTNYHSCVDLR